VEARVQWHTLTTTKSGFIYLFNIGFSAERLGEWNCRISSAVGGFSGK